MYVYFCNTDNIVNGYIFSNDIIVFPLCTVDCGKRVIKFVFVFVFVSYIS